MTSAGNLMARIVLRIVNGGEGMMLLMLRPVSLLSCPAPPHAVHAPASLRDPSCVTSCGCCLQRAGSRSQVY
ncbi:hypothetical protein O3P69_008574 [Scylla paramamosain]|uniref:Secreted protein n=1 Tax=Scylla paramamosain TaxID=85552 RepID=A0AAW0SM25_SCYPA